MVQVPLLVELPIFYWIKICINCALPRKVLENHESSLLTTKAQRKVELRVNQVFLSLTNLKKVPLDTPISDAASVFVVSWFIYLSNISLVLGGVTTFGLPNLIPFSFAILIHSIFLCLIFALSFSATNDNTWRTTSLINFPTRFLPNQRI